VDNIEVDIGEKRWGGADWTGLVQDREQWRALVSLAKNFQVP
jgi:hypothetical protein